ncbi:MAG TPA: 30S ribosomal protein S6 [Gemmatimonadaceae bacterium]|nr:30S ribosomal protein S6 [Gemmatimonadaceae bacterium]
MARPYEAVYIFDPGLEDAAINERLERFHALLGSPADLKVDHWGRRQLAYPISRKEQGYYVVARFSADGTALPEYERALRLDDTILRYLLTLHERDLGAPELSEEQLAAASARRGDDDDDDEE